MPPSIDTDSIRILMYDFSYLIDVLPYVSVTQELQDRFLSFAAYGSQKGEQNLDSRSFVKLFKARSILTLKITA